MAIYDTYYQEENYFGKAYKELITYFNNFPQKGTLLDLGCGQGRDSIELARLGFDVTGVDISCVGIQNMLEQAQKMKLSIKGLVEDVYAFNTINQYDIILLDSMLHFYKNDVEKESAFYTKILTEMKSGSVFCNLLLKSKKSEKYLKSIFTSYETSFTILKDDYIDYPEANCKYHMFVVQKN